MDFTLAKYEELCKAMVDSNYTLMNVYAYLETQPNRCIIIRHDVDRKVENALKMAMMESEHGIHSSYYFRTDKEGLAVMSFNVRDSYGSPSKERNTKQVLLNGRVVWEEDAAGQRGWEHFAVPVNIAPGANELELRLYLKAQGGAPITVWWDDIDVEPAGVLFAL